MQTLHVTVGYEMNFSLCVVCVCVCVCMCVTVVRTYSIQCAFWLYHDILFSFQEHKVISNMFVKEK